MTKLDHDDRESRIAKAAYAVLAEKGYGGASMLAIARASRASNETLYRWYGDKRGLFVALTRRNAERVRRHLDEGLTGTDDPEKVLANVAPILLTMLLDDPAILLNRAAAGDPSGELGRAIAQGGRQEIAPRIADLIVRAAEARGRKVPEPEVAATLFLNLLIGDLQIRRVIGATAVPDRPFVEARARQALTAFAALRDLWSTA
ncbi:TetR/AcrR family transcriptional regulator [Jannaschia sp. S6380]|uniref:TetR/AcrR family transcriptional regulator n=1 Tax=Jannaschia sp. S6380 TaxID=2926408 RepID=UPI001FF60486|nr:TetR/AcrR family transcriptional regulator [Jannaschia sp. S6380]MCK0166127.1 TetR/AcrR family transcriptional regulator [Jannaschia sp. S6380]